MDSPWKDYSNVETTIHVEEVVVVGIGFFIVLGLVVWCCCCCCALCKPDSDEPSKPYNAHGRRSERPGQPQEGHIFPTPSQPYPQTPNQNKPKPGSSEDFREHTYVNISKGPPPLPPKGNMPRPSAPLPPPSEPYLPTSSQNGPKTMAREDHEHTSASQTVDVPVSDGQRPEEPTGPQPGNMTQTPAPIPVPKPSEPYPTTSNQNEPKSSGSHYVSVPVSDVQTSEGPARPPLQGSATQTPASLSLYPILIPKQSDADLHAVVMQSKKEADVVKLQLIIRELQTKLYLTANDLGFNLLIGVDATPTRIGGYCVQLIDFNEPKVPWAETYTFSSSKLPWILNNQSIRGNSSEFEMKNLFFALLLWQDQIVEANRFAIYTDNSAIRNQKSKYGKRVRRLLNHLTDCRRAVLCNRSSMYINSSENIEYFDRYIQPADDLSRWKVSEAETFLSQLYGVPISRRSHVPSAQDSRNQQGEVSYKKTPAYNEMLEEVKEAAEEYEVPCEFCHFCIEDTGSLESIAISIC